MVVVTIHFNTGISVRPDRITIPAFTKPTDVRKSLPKQEKNKVIILIRLT
jgi:hypothetical protein